MTHTSSFPCCARLGALNIATQATEVVVHVDQRGVAVARPRHDTALLVPFNPCYCLGLGETTDPAVTPQVFNYRH
jgi:hypothetical protein